MRAGDTDGGVVESEVGGMADRSDGHRLGWLGTGRMGISLIHRLLGAGCDVTVYNRTKAKAEPLAAAGAKVVDTAAELGSAADIVFVTVGTSQDLIDALTGPAGLTSGGRVPSIVVDCSTVSAEASEQVRAELAARGCLLLAAPVMGNPKVAEVGRLTFAVSGSRAAFDTVQPYLDILGAGATYVGEGELARTVKLCHNLFLGVVTQSLAEVTVLAQKSGISRQALLACLNNSVMGSTFSAVQDAGLREPRLPPDLHLDAAAQGLRPWAGGGEAARGADADRVGGPPARAEPCRLRIRRGRLRDVARAPGPVGGPGGD